MSTINGGTNNHTIRERKPTENETIFGMDNSAVILGNCSLICELLNDDIPLFGVWCLVFS